MRFFGFRTPPIPRGREPTSQNHPGREQASLASSLHFWHGRTVRQSVQTPKPFPPDGQNPKKPFMSGTGGRNFDKTVLVKPKQLTIGSRSPYENVAKPGADCAHIFSSKSSISHPFFASQIHRGVRLLHSVRDQWNRVETFQEGSVDSSLAYNGFPLVDRKKAGFPMLRSPVLVFLVTAFEPRVGQSERWINHMPPFSGVICGKCLRRRGLRWLLREDGHDFVGQRGTGPSSPRWQPVGSFRLVHFGDVVEKSSCVIERVDECSCIGQGGHQKLLA